jgi:hypothetical protein
MSRAEYLSSVPKIEAEPNSDQPSGAARDTIQHWIHSVLRGEAEEIAIRVNAEGVVETHHSDIFEEAA